MYGWSDEFMAPEVGERLWTHLRDFRLDAWAIGRNGRDMGGRTSGVGSLCKQSRVRAVYEQSEQNVEKARCLLELIFFGRAIDFYLAERILSKIDESKIGYQAL